MWVTLWRPYLDLYSELSYIYIRTQGKALHNINMEINPGPISEIFYFEFAIFSVTKPQRIRKFNLLAPVSANPYLRVKSRESPFHNPLPSTNLNP